MTFTELEECQGSVAALLRGPPAVARGDSSRLVLLRTPSLQGCLAGATTGEQGWQMAFGRSKNSTEKSHCGFRESGKGKPARWGLCCPGYKQVADNPSPPATTGIAKGISAGQ